MFKAFMQSWEVPCCIPQCQCHGGCQSQSPPPQQVWSCSERSMALHQEAPETCAGDVLLLITAFLQVSIGSCLVLYDGPCKRDNNIKT